MNNSHKLIRSSSSQANKIGISLLGILTLLLMLLFPAQAATKAQAPADTPTSTSIGIFERPLVVINQYSINPNPVNPGQDFDISVEIYNAGQTSARNIVISFPSTDFLPRNTGGVIAVANIFPGNRQSFTQTMTAQWSLWGSAFASLDMNVGYTDEAGNAYNEKFTISINLNVPRGNPATATSTPTVTPTATSGPILRPQLVITSYDTDVVPLQPGATFNLALQIENLGNALAKRVTMIVGGGTTQNQNGTPEPGISGGSGEFTNFAPLGRSNIQSLGEIPAGGMLNTSQSLIVNVNTNPGAYPMKISFVYTSETGSPVTDEQVITLLVYSLPSVEISFYRDPGQLFVGQPNMLPLQITNLSRKTSVLGNMRVNAPSGMLENNTILIGSLEPGGYYTLDSTFFPDTAGTVELEITVDYVDDFGQPGTITKSLNVDVLDFIPPEEPFPPDEGFQPPMETANESFLQKLWRLILGLLGLDSGKPEPEIIPFSEEGSPIEQAPVKEIPLKGP